MFDTWNILTIQIMSQYFSWVKNFALKNETASLIKVIGRI